MPASAHFQKCQMQHKFYPLGRKCKFFEISKKKLIGCRETFADDLKNDFAKETDLMFDSNMDVKIKMVQASNGGSSG